MGAAATQELSEKVGLTISDFQSSKLAVVDSKDVAHFIPPKYISIKYKEILESQISFDEYSCQLAVKKYTEHTTQLCTRLNLALASDNEILMSESLHEDWNLLSGSIRQLAKEKKFDILKYPECYRGFFCSPIEFAAYIPGEVIYMPSFLSTSLDSKKSYKRTQEKSNINTLMIIKLTQIPNSALEITSEFSDYAKDEKELLFCCYSKFKVIATEEYQNREIDYKIFLEYLIDYNPEYENINQQNESCILTTTQQTSYQYKRFQQQVNNNWKKHYPHQKLGIILPFINQINNYLISDKYENLQQYKQHIACFQDLLKNKQWHQFTQLKGKSISFSAVLNRDLNIGEILYFKQFLILKNNEIDIHQNSSKIKIYFAYEPKSAIQVPDNLYYSNINYKDYILIDCFSKFKVVGKNLGKKWYREKLKLEYLNQPELINQSQQLFFAGMIH